jgi:hypothetical protein
LSSPVAAATRAGEASVIVPDDGRAGAGKPLNSGRTGTPFSLKLPTGASCRGDSANDGYRVQSYMVPASVDPATLTFGSVGPLPTATGQAFREPLFAATSDPVVNQQTAAATKPPGPGPIVNIPAMNFAVYKPGDVPAGTYDLGIACTRGAPSPAQLDTYWNARLEVKAGLGAAGDAPLWTVVKPTTPQAPGAAPSSGAASSGAASAPEVASSPAGAEHGTSAAAPATGTAASVTRRRGTASRRESAPSGAPPSFHLPVTALFPRVPLRGEVFATMAFALAAGALTTVVVRRGRYGTSRWTGSAQLPVATPEGQ